MATGGGSLAVIESVAQAVDIFANLKRAPEEYIVFRGHADQGWKLQPLIRRSPDAVKSRENELVRELIAVAPSEFRDDDTMFDRLVRMQHFGLPTRLLDTTSNPLVALYFASEEADGEDGAVVTMLNSFKQRKYFDSDTVSCLSHLSNLTQDERQIIERTTATTQSKFNELLPVDRLVQFIRTEKPSFRAAIRRGDLFSRIHVVPKMNNKRIVAQSGSFIIFGLKKIPTVRVGIRVDRILVKASAKKNIRSVLESLGIHESSMFPELDKAAANVVRRCGA